MGMGRMNESTLILLQKGTMIWQQRLLKDMFINKISGFGCFRQLVGNKFNFISPNIIFQPVVDSSFLEGAQMVVRQRNDIG